MTAPKTLSQPDLPSVSIILLGGLPGSGKTCYLNALVERGWKCFDDFQKRAHNDSAEFSDSRRFEELIEELRQGSRCVVADIRVIHAPYRDGAFRALRRELRKGEIEVHLFTNEPSQCAINVRNAPDRRMDKRLAAIEFWSKHYSCPPNARVIPVWRPTA